MNTDHIKRYTYHERMTELEESPEGEWVRWSDVQELVEMGLELKRLREICRYQPSQEFIDNFNNRTHRE